MRQHPMPRTGWNLCWKIHGVGLQQLGCSGHDVSKAEPCTSTFCATWVDVQRWPVWTAVSGLFDSECLPPGARLAFADLGNGVHFGCPVVYTCQLQVRAPEAGQRSCFAAMLTGKKDSHIHGRLTLSGPRILRHGRLQGVRHPQDSRGYCASQRSGRNARVGLAVWNAKSALL